MSSELRHHIEKIIPLSDKEFEYLFSHFTVKRLKKHQFLIQNPQSAKAVGEAILAILK